MKRRLEALVKERDQLLDEWANDKDSRLKLLVRIMDL
ncbi:MAG TPA: chromosome segregation protein SMC, partial [Firmicutes bacterium]|nr:chromosome segregation protein SMC [Bacillota bacterium]